MSRVLFVLASAWSGTAFPQVEPGSWELTVIMQMADADKPVKCSGALPMAGTGSLRQGAAAFTGQLELTAGGGFRMNTKISGRRLGPC